MRNRGGYIAVPAIADISVFPKRLATKQHPATAYKNPAKYRKIGAYRILRRPQNAHKKTEQKQSSKAQLFPAGKSWKYPSQLIEDKEKKYTPLLKTCPCFKGIATSVSAYCCGLYILKTCPCCKGIAIKNADGCRRFFFWLRQPHRGIRNHANRRRRLGASPDIF